MDSPRHHDPIPSCTWDVVVVGAGAAGLMSCLELPKDLSVLLLNRNTGRRSSSRWAQGGIAAVTRADDNAASHAEDTRRAGAGLCDGDAVRLLVEQAPHLVERLQNLGMAFDRDGAELATTLEAAHSHHRVLHVQDRTGKALVEVLQDRVVEREGLLHRRGVRVTALWVENQRCCGVQVLDGSKLHWIRARAVVLASGGGGHLFANTTNPATEEFDVFGLFDSGTLSAEFSANTVLQALAQVTNVRVMQNPVVFTADNQEAFFFDGSEFPFANQVIANAGTAGGTQSFEYRSVGLVLNARPRITAQKDVDMDIRLELSKIGPAINDGGPTVDRRQTTTNIVVKNGQTIILSGLLKEEEIAKARSCCGRHCVRVALHECA